MKTIVRKQLSLAVCALALGIASGAAQAQRPADPLPGNPNPDESRQTWTELRNQVWLNTYGQCWRNNFGPPPGVGECAPRPLAQYVAPVPVVVPAPAPVIVAPAPAPVIEPAPLPPKRDRN